ncbi:MAG: hypothetical protein ACKO38_15930 [Planctomycetota bacterium]
MQRFENLLSVALADGRLTEREMRLLSERAREWRLDDHQFTVAVNHCLERPGHLRIPEERSERAELLRDALSVMASDGQLMDAEKRLFAFIAARMDFSAAEIDAIIMELVEGSTDGNAQTSSDSSTASKSIKPSGKGPTSTKIAAKSGTKPTAKSGTKSGTKSTAKSGTKSPVQTGTKSAAKSATKPIADSTGKAKTKPTTKSGTKSTAKSGNKFGKKSSAKPNAKPVTKASAKDTAKARTKSTKSAAKNPRAGAGGKKASRRAHETGLVRRAPR